MGRIGLDLMSKTLTLDAYSLDFSKVKEWKLIEKEVEVLVHNITDSDVQILQAKMEERDNWKKW